MAIETTPTAKSTSRDQRPNVLRGVAKRRWWKRCLLAIGMIAVMASAVAVVAITRASRNASPGLTHTVTRGDLVVTLTEQGTLESSENVEVKCKVRGHNTVIWVIESGSIVKPGDELVRLDSLFIEEQIDERSKYAHWSRSASERSAATVESATLRVAEYDQGTYVAKLMALETDLVIAKAALRSAKNILSHTRLMAESDYISSLEVEEKEFAVAQAELDVKLNKTKVEVHKQFTKKEQLQTLNGKLAAAKATHSANVERAAADASRRDRALDEIQHCVVRAEQSGMVIHPDAAIWLKEPIAEGTNVHKNQVLLLMPDLTKMQVKLGIHESKVDRMKEGLTAKVTLPNMTLDGSVSSVAKIAKPAAIWSGNAVKYDTFIRLPPVEGLSPGMSAEIEVIIARYENVLTIPVAAIVETEEANFCWVNTPEGIKRREIVVGDSNDIFSIVEKGLVEGDTVTLNPSAFGTPPIESTKKDDKTETLAAETKSE